MASIHEARAVMGSGILMAFPAGTPAFTIATTVYQVSSWGANCTNTEVYRLLPTK